MGQKYINGIIEQVGNNKSAYRSDLQINGLYSPVYSKNPNGANCAVLDFSKLKDFDFFFNAERVSEYLYEISYSNLDYKYANKYFEENFKPIVGPRCSGIRNGNFFGRDFDWNYDSFVSFVTHIKSDEDRYASMCVCNTQNILNTNFMSSGDYDDMYKLIPFCCQDGINSEGVFCSINVCPTDKGKVNVVIPSEREREVIMMRMLPRFVLDRYGSAEDAVKDISKYITIYGDKKTLDLNDNLHFMIGDPNKNYILEFIPDENNIMRANYHETDTTRSPFDNMIMTNFYVNDIVFNSDGTVYTPETQDAEHNAFITNKITKNGSGLERYNLAVNRYNDANTKAGMIDLMHALDYRRSYSTCPEIYGKYGVSDPYWYTELVGGYKTPEFTEQLHVDDPYTDFSFAKEVFGQQFLHRKRDDDKTWHTTHSSVYDLNKKELYLFDSSEDEIEHTFSFVRKYEM